MNRIDIPIVLAPGSQPADEDGLELEYMQMPSGMSTYAMPVIPEPEEIEGVEAAIARDTSIWPGDRLVLVSGLLTLHLGSAYPDAASHLNSLDKTLRA